MTKVFTEKQLRAKVGVETIRVTGQYIAQIDDKRKTYRNYDIELEVPAGFDRADIKNLVPEALRNNEKYEDFAGLRTQNPDYSSVKKTGDKRTRKDFMTDRMLRQNDRRLRTIEKDKQGELSTRARLGDTSEYDDATGLPPLVEVRTQ